ncbi:hypothetical protein EVAR_69570_1 [Eumeta japonica]|uniref:Uncharacterized protein n=1 Tax=Eumeta variegata TaxID=151549 RepID=A0A4C1ZET4_EUMVA|nr:hypothetical protein EVAR_69570_1 [Eumeta japonica]
MRDMHEMEELTSYVSMRTIGIRVGSAEEEIRLFAAYSQVTPLCVQDIHFIPNSHVYGGRFKRQTQGVGMTLRVQGWETSYGGRREPGLRGAGTRYSNVRPDRPTPPHRCT